VAKRKTHLKWLRATTPVPAKPRNRSIKGGKIPKIPEKKRNNVGGLKIPERAKPPAKKGSWETDRKEKNGKMGDLPRDQLATAVGEDDRKRSTEAFPQRTPKVSKPTKKSASSRRGQKTKKRGSGKKIWGAEVYLRAV